jgi:hypothetical protein
MGLLSLPDLSMVKMKVTGRKERKAEDLEL